MKKLLLLLFLFCLPFTVKAQYGHIVFSGGTIPDATTFESLVTFEAGFTVTGGLVTINVAVTINATLDLDPTAATITAVYRVAHIQGTLTTTSGTGDVYGLQVAPKSVTINSGNVHPIVASLFIAEPDITETSGSVTTAATLYIEGAPTEGTGNSALIVASGNVCIGCTNPGTLLEMQAEAADADLTIVVFDDDATELPAIVFEKADGTAASPALVDDNDVLGEIRFFGHDGTNFDLGARIFGRVNGTASGGTDMPTELVFSVSNNGSASPTERLNILETGFLVHSAARFTQTHTAGIEHRINTDNNSNDNTSDGFISFYTDGGALWAMGFDNDDSDKFKISENATLGTNDRFVISSGGAITQETFVIRKHVALSGATDNTATNFFTVTTTDESGSADGGSYSVSIHLMVNEAGAASGAVNTASKSMKAHFARIMASAGTGTNSAMGEISETDSANEGTGAITTVTLTIVETSEFIQTIQLLVNTSGGTFDGFALIELVYSDFTTAPVVSGI